MNDEIQNKIKIFVVVLRTEPDAVYNGKTFTQFAYIQFIDGKQVGIFDHKNLCTPEIVGKNKTITLSMPIPSLEKIDINQSSVKVVSTPILDICGCIKEIIQPDNQQSDKKWRKFIIDFGLGKIVLDVDIEKYAALNLKNGDYIHAIGRVDLESIE